MLVFIALVASANEPVYVDALASGWSSWSWSGTYDLAATDLVVGGKSMKATEQAWGALSLHDGNGRMQAQAWTGLRFAFEGDGSKVGISLQSDTESYSSAAVAISTLATTSAGTFTTVTF